MWHIAVSSRMTAFGAKRTSRERREHADPTKMTHCGHRPARNPAVQQSPAVPMCGHDPAVLLRSYAKRTRKADTSAAAVIGALTKNVLR